MIMVRVLASVVISAAFGVLFQVRAKHVPFAGITGGVGYLVYAWASALGLGAFAALLLASAATAVCAELFARTRKCPATVFQIAGLIPLVPGMSMFYAMQHGLSEQPQDASMMLFKALLEAGAIAVGIILVSSLMRPGRRGVINEKTAPARRPRR